MNRLDMIAKTPIDSSLTAHIAAEDLAALVNLARAVKQYLNDDDSHSLSLAVSIAPLLAEESGK